MMNLEIKKALVSVWDKRGLGDFCQTLAKFNIEIYSSGGTWRFLEARGIKAQNIEKITGFSQLLGGRVKTLHPLIHAAILARKDDARHMAELKKIGISPFDLVVVNLYPFLEKRHENLTLEQMQEYIDIGGPTMLRAAAKNFQSVAVISSPSQYKMVAGELVGERGKLSLALRKKLAGEAFAFVSQYDSAIAEFLAGSDRETKRVVFRRHHSLRYGENPQQKAALYKIGGEVSFEQLGGKELSYNNFLDLDAALSLVRYFKRLPAACVIKHGNPCGVALAGNLALAYRKAFMSDALSSFGGIIGLNKEVDEKTARAVIRSGFREAVIAPGFSREALDILREKKNLRLIKADFAKHNSNQQIRKTAFGYLIQEEDLLVIDNHKLQIVTKKKPTAREIEDLLFAWFVAKYTKSNAIVIAKNLRTLGIGCGQPSRIGAMEIAIRKSCQSTQGAVLASDGFFPKEDNLELAKSAGIKALIQPGGSLKDKDLIKLADKLNLSMIFTSLRHFRH